MKIIDCYMENFGKFSQKLWNLDEPFVQIIAQNGAGKTTLADFIRVMFYGMPNKNKDEPYSLRERYMPYNNLAFGGYLTFENAEGKYRIERFFGKGARGGDDAVKLYLNDVPVTPPENIGEFFFRMNENSFLHTLFVGDIGYDEHGTGDIKNRLGGFPVEDEGVDGFDVVCKKLEAEIKKYKPDQKKGVIADLAAAKNQLNGEIAKCDAEIIRLDELYERCNDLNKQIAEIKEMRKNAADAGVLAEKWKRYDELNAELENAVTRFEELKKAYPCGIPSAEIIAETSAAVSRAEAAKKALADNASDIDAESYSRLKARFEKGAPTERELSECRDKCARIERLTTESTVHTARNIPFADNFDRRVPTEEEKEKCDMALSELREARERLNAIEQNAAQPVEQKKQSPALIVFAALFFALALIGVAVIFKNMNAGIAMTAIGILGAFVTGFAFLLRRGGAKRIGEDGAYAEIQRCKNEIERYGLDVYSLLSKFGFERQTVAEDDAKRFFAAYAEYVAAKQNENEMLKKQNEADTIKTDLNNYFASFGIPCENGYRKAIEDLRISVSEYLSVEKRLSDHEKKRAELNALFTEATKNAQNAVARFGVSVEDWASFAEIAAKDALNSVYLSADINKKRTAKDAARPDLPRPQTADTVALDERAELLRESKAEVDRMIASAERAADRKNDCLGEIAKIDREMEGYRYLYELYADTLSKVKIAEMRVDERFVGPIKERFGYYFEGFSEMFGRTLTLNRDFDIMVTDGGVTRKDALLSSGENALISFCFRVALIDLLFEGESAFLVLDDCFCRLDEAKIVLLRPLIDKLSNRFQTIYFTCSDSRALK